MPLAPRYGRGAGQSNAAETGRTSVKSAAGKAKQRARTNSGSSGAATKLAKYPQVDWAGVEADNPILVADIAGKVVQSQMGAGGYYTMLVAIPMAYIHQAVDAAIASQQGMLYMRMYQVPLRLFTDEDDSTEVGNGEHTTA